MYAYDPINESAVIGPSNLFGQGVHAIAERHEFGGTAARPNPRRKLRRLGRTGEIRVGGPAGMATKHARDTLRGAVNVTYAPLTTQAQVRRANRLNAALYGPAILHGTYPTRPFMRPSLELIAPRMADYVGKATR